MLKALLRLSFAFLLVWACAAKSNVELKDGWYFLDGHKTFVNAIGYEIGALPGQHPYEHRVTDLAHLKSELATIKAAGFNAIRTWSQMNEQELQVVQASGLNVIFGLWLKPDNDFSDPKVVEEDLNLVRSVLAYSKKYDCVITYLIMNEPMPRLIQKVGGQATRDLWVKVLDLIHHEHPGVPVTISGNSSVLSFLDMNLFDVYAYNAYDYDGQNRTYGYASANRMLKERNAGTKPLLLTEFGRSVSRTGRTGYGGNTLTEQSDALLRYYRGLLDAGATGACPFIFADGWWKGGKPETHEDTAEEWFGFWGYRDANDKVGYPRPVWHALETYNQAIVASPKNEEFYQNQVPMEIFFQDDVAKFRVIQEDRILYESPAIKNRYFTGELSFAGEGLRDRELAFEFYDRNGRLLKTETLIVLTGKEPVRWPELEVRTAMKNLDDAKDVAVEFGLKGSTPFALSDEVRCLFAHHIDWEAGETHLKKVDPTQAAQTWTDTYQIPEKSPMLGIFAATEIRYGKFVRTIYDQKYVYRGIWADPIRLR